MPQMKLLHKYTPRNEEGGKTIVVKFELQIYLKIFEYLSHLYNYN